MDLGVMKNVIFGDFTLEGGFASYVTKNVQETQEEVEILCNGEYDVEFIDMVKRPTLTMTFRYVDIDDYRKFVRQVNQRSVIVNYYDYELGQRVTRTMMLETYDIERLMGQFTDIFSVEGLTVTFKSVYGYLTYEDLETGVHQ